MIIILSQDIVATGEENDKLLEIEGTESGEFHVV